MDDDEMAQVAEGVVLLPMTAGSVVLAYNLPELTKPLRLPRDVYAKIFLGQISSWSDPAIAAANTDVKLPNLPMAELENAAGNYVAPTLENANAALAGVKMPEDLRAWLPDPSDEHAYPIVSYTWLLCYRKYDDSKKAEALKNLVRWCLTEGQKSSAEMGFVPLPENVVSIVTEKLKTIQ